MPKDINTVSGWRLVVLFPVALLLRLWGKTLRFRFEGDAETILKEHQEASVLILWHNRLLLAGEIVQRYRKGRRPIAGLVSGSSDGAWLAGFFTLLGIESIRGSQGGRGAQAVRDMIAAVGDGKDVAVTPDGSRGPIYKAKGGSLKVAEHTQAPIKLLSATFSKAHRLRSWDGFYLPYPFSTITVHAEQWDNAEALQASDPELPLTVVVSKRLMAMTEDVPMPTRSSKPSASAK